MQPDRKPEHKPGKDVPESIAKKEPPEEIGGTHGEATGAWRVLINSTVIAIVVLLAILLVYNLAWA